MPKKFGLGEKIDDRHLDVPRLTSSEILRGEEDLDKLSLDVHSVHFLAFSVPPEHIFRHGRVLETLRQEIEKQSDETAAAFTVAQAMAKNTHMALQVNM